MVETPVVEPGAGYHEGARLLTTMRNLFVI
jgi:hypothetical protein